MGIFGINKYLLELGVQGGNTREDDDNTSTDDTTPNTPDTQDDNGDTSQDNPDNGDEPQDNPEDNPDNGDEPQDNPDDTESQDNGDEPQDNPDNGDDNNTSQDNPDNGDEPQDNPDDGGDNNVESDPDLDDGTDDSSGEEDTDDSLDDVESDNGEQDLGAMEDEIFASLNTAQKTIKVAELKGTFSALYRSCDETLDKVSKLPNTKETAMVYNNVTNRLMDLKKYLEFYITYTFDTKTYLENQAIYQKYLAIYSAIKEALCTVDKKLKDHSEDV